MTPSDDDMNKKLIQFFKNHLIKIELVFLLLVLLKAAPEETHIPGTGLALLVCSQLLMVAYFFPAFSLQKKNSPNEDLVIKLSRFGMVISALAVVFALLNWNGYKPMLVSGGILLSSLPLLYNTLLKTKPPKEEIFRISAWLLLCAAFLYSVFSSELLH